MRMTTNNDVQRIVLLLTIWGTTGLFVHCLTDPCGLTILPTLDIGIYESNYNSFIAKPFHRQQVPFNETHLVKKLWSFHCGIVGTAGGAVDDSVTPAPAPEKSFQWTAALNTRSPKVCSGAMISDRWVLTTADCATPRIDELYLGANEDGGFDSKVVVDKTIIHNEYNNVTKENNIALLRLKTRVFISAYIRPACIPIQEFDLMNRRCFISGFQNISSTFIPGTLKYVSASVMPLEICAYTYRLMNIGLLDIRNICVDVWRRQGCYANVGSPLTCVVKNRHYVAGVFSTSKGNCTNFIEPLVFTRLTAFSQWIYRIVDWY